MKIYAQRLLLDGKWLAEQVVTVLNGRIEDIAPGSAGDLSCNILTPGLVDVHAHGGEVLYRISRRGRIGTLFAGFGAAWDYRCAAHHRLGA